MRYGHLTQNTCLALLLLSLGAATGRSQEWARKMFDTTSHDFGTVARGANVEHRFTVENIYEEDAHIAAVRTSCGCTVPTVTKQNLKTWEKSEIIAKIDTRGYYGRKDATVTVVFDRPFPAEVQLKIHTFIRSDVVVQPGSVQFGTLAQGVGGERKVTISYAGRADWEILEVESPSPHLEAKVVKAPITTPGRVTYQMVVTLKKDTPVGHIWEHLVLVTNDQRAKAARVPIAVEARVASTVSVRPSPLTGVVDVGETMTKQLFVQGQAPFKITAVECDDARFKFSHGETAKTLHLIPVIFTPGDASGKIRATIRIRTDRAAAAELTVPVDIRVMPKGPVSF